QGRDETPPGREKGMASTLLGHLRRWLEGQPPDEPPDEDVLRRFIEHADEAAFAVLVQRHGPLGWGVCKRLLRSGQAAEDAVQATFLTRARRAPSISRRGSLSCWLHGVAYRLALKLRRADGRRRLREGRAIQRPPGDPLDEVTGRELLAVLDE